MKRWRLLEKKRNKRYRAPTTKEGDIIMFHGEEHIIGKKIDYSKPRSTYE